MANIDDTLEEFRVFLFNYWDLLLEPNESYQPHLILFRDDWWRLACQIRFHGTFNPLPKERVWDNLQVSLRLYLTLVGKSSTFTK